jgi:CMP-N-acetylneuraminic acid synthetase
VFEPEYTPIKSYIQKSDGSINGLYSEDAPYSRRQDLPKAYQPNGAIYAFSTEEFEKKNSFPKMNVYPYIMSEYESVDVDTINDLKIVEQRLKELSK